MLTGNKLGTGSIATVKRIAVLNPYLQGGHTETAEMESTARFIQIANKHSIDVKVVASSDEINDYDPDFVFSLTYQCAKRSKYPSYVSVNIPVSMVENVPRFVRNILTYDAFLTASASVDRWLKYLCAVHGKTFHIAPGYFSVPATEFSPCDYTNATAMYMGTNWDGTRHKNLFMSLSDGAWLKCYGPKKSWQHYPATIYGGEVPFDGVTSLKLYHQHACGLCIGYPVCDNEGIANNRMYEIVAAGALPICSSNNEIIKDAYGDNVLYIDNLAPTELLAKEIIEKIQWIRSNPNRAEEMARAAHAIFNKQLTMEYYLDQMLALHTKVMQDNGYKKTERAARPSPRQSENKTHDPKILYIIRSRFVDEHIIPVLLSIKNQGYSNIEVVLLSQYGSENLLRLYQQLNLPDLKIHAITYHGRESNHDLINYLDETNADWIAVLGEEDTIFANHSTMLLNASHRVAAGRIAAIRTGCVEVSNMERLQEPIVDEHYIKDLNFTRLGLEARHLSQILFKYNYYLLADGRFAGLDFYELTEEQLLEILADAGETLNTYEISCAVKCPHDIQKPYQQ